MDEPLNVTALTPFVEVIGTEVFTERFALQHFIRAVRIEAATAPMALLAPRRARRRWNCGWR